MNILNMPKSKKYNAMAFTLLEVLVALAVVAIAVIALLRLHLISICLTERTAVQTRALLLAQQKLEQSCAEPTLKPGVTHGLIDEDDRSFRWRQTVTPFRPPDLAAVDMTSFYRVDLSVSFPDGGGDVEITLSTCRADRPSPTQRIERIPSASKSADG